MTFTPDGRTLLVANEGEPAENYSVDPQSSVSIIPVGPNGTIGGLEQADVRAAGFNAWDAGTKALHPDVRVFGPNEDSAPASRRTSSPSTSWSTTSPARPT